MIWNGIKSIRSEELERVRPDELQAAYLIFDSYYQSVSIKKEALYPFRKRVREILFEAIYFKTVELFALKTISNIFQCKFYLYGIRLNVKTHPNEAFTEDKLQDVFSVSRTCKQFCRSAL